MLHELFASHEVLRLRVGIKLQLGVVAEVSENI